MIKTVYQGVVHPWMCDIMGHFTTRHYVAMFDDASYHFLFEVFGWTGSAVDQAQEGWVDAKHIIEYQEEVKAGALVEIRAQITRMGGKSITCRYEMYVKGGSDQAVASMEVVNVFFDTEARQAKSLTEEMRKKAEGYIS